MVLCGGINMVMDIVSMIYTMDVHEEVDTVQNYWLNDEYPYCS